MIQQLDGNKQIKLKKNIVVCGITYQRRAKQARKEAKPINAVAGNKGDTVIAGAAVNSGGN
jgi:hypothetical protein